MDESKEIKLSKTDRSILTNIVRGLAELAESVSRLKAALLDLTDKLPKQ